jgi:uncharacterized membrane protein YidH (DUF202 family)
MALQRRWEWKVSEFMLVLILRMVGVMLVMPIGMAVWPQRASALGEGDTYDRGYVRGVVSLMLMVAASVPATVVQKAHRRRVGDE